MDGGSAFDQPSDVDTAENLLEPVRELDAPKPRVHQMSAGSRALRDRRIGHFTVLGTLGRGGMGVVLRAYDETLARMVALKLLNRKFAGPRQQRLLREGQALAQLSHPNVVQIYEMGMVEGQMFIAMELVLGDPLRTWQHEPRPWREVLDTYLQAGRGLEAAHEQGLIHRDFKPENIIIGDDGRVRVLDFGLARGTKLTSDGPVSMSRVSLDGVDEIETSLERKLTQSGTVLGTMRYLPLQQLSGEPADEKSDQYSFCVSLYEGLYGTRPFPDSTLVELLKSLENETLAPVARSGVPKRLRKILLRGLSRDPNARWPSIKALLTELERARRPRRWGQLAAAGALAGGGVAAVMLAYPTEDPCEAVATSLEDTWGPEQREAVRRAFTTSDHLDAATLLARVEAHFDDFGQAWTQMAEDSCHATFVEHIQSEELFDRRMQCLQRHRSRLRSTIDSVAAAETPRQLSDRSILPFTLPTVRSCADVDTLMARQPLPDDPEARATIEALRTRLDRANTLREIGELTEGIELAEAVVEQARTIDYSPVLAEALESLGHLQADGGQIRKAQATLDETIEVAAQAKADQVAARAWALLVYALMAQDKFEQASTLENAARAAVERGDDEIARGWLLNNLGAMHGARGDFPRSHRYLREALEVKQRALGEDHVDVGIAWANLGKAFEDHGSQDEALTAFGQALEIFESTVGPSHPYVAFAQTGLGNVRRDRGELAEAAEHHRRALAVREAVFGPSEPSTAWSQLALGETELGLERLTEARTHVQQALSVFEQTRGPTHPKVAHVLAVLAEIELAAGQPVAARPHAERAHAIAQSRPEAVEPLARARFLLARSQPDTDDGRARALALARQARDDLTARPEATTQRSEIDAWLSTREVAPADGPR